jgi:Arc/MetJ-type ribon-helix-helix transcriptional regulator
MSPENERFLKQLVEHDRFPTMDAALDAAVGFARREYEKDITKLRAELESALRDIDEGRAGPLDVDEFKRRGRERWEARRKRAEAG